MDSTGLNELVCARHARPEQRRVVLIMGRQLIVRLRAVSGADLAVETAADAATLDH